MRLVVYSLTGCLLCSTAVAKYCVKLPTCEELGYIYSADKYPNNRSIKCPFDTKKILLLDYCQAYGLTSCDSTSGECDECIVEKADGTKSNSGYWRYTRCNAGYSYKSGECPPTEVDRTQYPYEGSEGLDESIGEIECVQSAQNTYCGYKSCNEGWNFNSGNCIVNDCGNSYPYTSCDINGTCTTCQSGTNTKYSAPTCNNGWYTSGSACVENDCSAFTSSSLTIANCSTTSSCQKGTTTVYKCDACATDYELVNGSCVQSCALTSTSLPTNCTTATETCNKDGTTYYSTTCKTCNDGYELSGTSCTAAACTGYNSTTTSITGCKTVSSACLSGTTNKYKCNTCYTGYSPSNGGCTKTCTYTATSKPSNCKTVSSCQLGSASGTTTYYSSSCTTCNDGYYNINGKCKLPCTTPGACEVGDIYAYNGSAIGVVFFDDGSTTKIVALTDIKKDGTSGSERMYWSTSSSGTYSYTTGATIITDEMTAFNDTNGKYNTTQILNYIASKGYTAEAATATSKYAPSACGTGSMCAKGNWYLPAAGELYTLYSKKSTLNSKFTSNSGTAFKEDYYWSSTEAYSDRAWVARFDYGTRWDYNKYSSHYVRPVLALCADGYEIDANGACQVSCAYTSTSKPSNCSTATDSCVKNGTTYYSTTCATCADGWTASNGSCVANTCSGYPSTSSSITGCKTVSSTTCMAGNTKKYKCGTCYTGYSLSSGKCTKTCTYTATAKPSNCTTSASCQLGSASGTKTYYSSSCTTCNDGYTTNSSGGCSYINTCTGVYPDENYMCKGTEKRTTPFTDDECISLYGRSFMKARSCTKGIETYYECYYSFQGNLPCEY